MENGQGLAAGPWETGAEDLDLLTLSRNAEDQPLPADEARFRSGRLKEPENGNPARGFIQAKPGSYSPSGP